VLDRLGLSTRVQERLRTFPNGATAMRAMAEAPERAIGCTQATEILSTRGARLVAPLPPGFDLQTVYTAAVNTHAPKPDGARRFVSSIGAEGSRELRAAAGFRGPVVRPALPADFDAIRSIVRAVFAEYDLGCGTDRDLENIASSYLDRGGAFDVVAGEDGRVVGCCGVYPIDSTTCELRKMYLLPQARGHGLGERLLRRALAFARGQGFRRMELETAAVLKHAIALYEREGFKPIARKPSTSRCDRAFALDL
jgi:GNAT superfamily N-acetyltransferase